MLTTGQSGQVTVKNHQQPTPFKIVQPDFSTIFVTKSKGQSLLTRSVAKHYF
jgi:hypothetical protein